MMKARLKEIAVGLIAGLIIVAPLYGAVLAREQLDTGPDLNVIQPGHVQSDRCGS